MRQLHLIYSRQLTSAFEVHDAISRVLLGHVTFTIEHDKPGKFCFIPVGKKRGYPHATLLGALKEYFKTEVGVHFLPNVA
jgi:hypothetical protein